MTRALPICPVPSGAPDARITILLAVHNGARFLRDQLDSYLRQTDRNWGLIAGIDGSDDGSREIVAAFADSAFTRHVPIQTIEGPKTGFAANFLNLLRTATQLDDDGLIALSDQDDVWFPEKLARARAALAAYGDEPALYCARSMVCNAELEDTRPSAAFKTVAGFRHSLTQNMAAGNTIVLNDAARRLVALALRHVDDVVSHDWWLYQLITGAGGHVIYDHDPALFYRQHGRNVLGENRSLGARLRRVQMVLRGTYRSWRRRNLDALWASRHLLTPENRRLLFVFSGQRQDGPRTRLGRLLAVRPHRGGAAPTMLYWVLFLCRLA